ncbi:C4-dicarboxylate transporter DcuC [Zavarzinella formosa]|uniref:C4-dicarboxylate transporter DcuC n=1 Tax=Zavarzinella formosa TaxID=360055 RepID=UPI0002D9E101|nr:C4-dicarboxylate transporter DcuC [Zavarzinella formosa]
MDGSILTILAAGLIVAAAVVAIIRGIDVRLALLLAALAIGGLEGDIAPIVREFLTTFSNEKFVIPICTAMGFAYVLRHTECDQHLVRALTKPLQYARLFLIPGVVAVGFMVNIPVISQTSTAVCLGAVVVPLMRAARLSNVAIGSTILLGASIGGELLNPGAPELNTVGQRLGMSPTKVVSHVVPLLFPHVILATLIFWYLTVRGERQFKGTIPEVIEPPVSFRVNIFRALVPVVPLVVLFLIGPPFNVFKVPERWVVTKPVEVLGQLAGAPAMVLFDKKDSGYETRLIGAAMLLGVALAALSHRQKIRGVPKAFFEGAGHAFTDVISLIVIANCFGKAIELVGLTRVIGYLVGHAPDLLDPLAGAIPCGFAAIGGSGIAATQSLYSFYVAPANAVGADPADIGAVVSLSSAAGRTLSPVAAVCLMAAKLTGTNSFQLMRRVAPPLLVSLTVVIGLRMLGVLEALTKLLAFNLSN